MVPQLQLSCVEDFSLSSGPAARTSYHGFGSDNISFLPKEDILSQINEFCLTVLNQLS